MTGQNEPDPILEEVWRVKAELSVIAESDPGRVFREHERWARQNPNRVSPLKPVRIAPAAACDPEAAKFAACNPEDGKR